MNKRDFNRLVKSIKQMNKMRKTYESGRNKWIETGTVLGQPMKPAAITSKSDSTKAFLEGRFGNKPRAWESLKDLFASQYFGNVTLRTKNRSSGGAGYAKYGVPRNQAVDALHLDGIDASTIYCNESMPDSEIVSQGELMRCPDWHYSWSPDPVPMRTAMKTAKTITGAMARWHLQSKMDPSSWDNLLEFMDSYPTAIIELTVFGVQVGDMPGRNTIIWEVRDF